MSKVRPSNVKTLATSVAGLGLVSLAFFVLTYIQYYDDIGSLEKKGDNTDSDGSILTTADLPLGLLLQIEMLGSVILTLGGISGMLGSGSKATRSAVFIISFLGLVCFGVTGVMRTQYLWGESEGNCKYFGNSEIHGATGDYIKACPTTRHESQKPSPSAGFWNISETEPLFRSDCVFWFWDNTFTLESALVSTGGLAGTGAGVTIDPSKKEALKNEMLNNMNWEDKKNYGFMEVDSPCENDLGATDCIADGRTVYETIEMNAKAVTDGGADEYGVPIVKKLPGPDGNKQIPDISFCYYWGCNEVCNHYRYRINRLLHYGALFMALMSLVFTAMAGLYSFAVPVGYFDPKAALPTVVAKQIGEEPKSKWKPMSVKSSNIQKRNVDSRKLRF